MTKSTHRSGGPRTEAGRQAVSRNALKTGAYAACAVLPGEDRALYQQLEDELIQDFGPADTASRLLVRTLAGLMWKKLRLERIEQVALADTLMAPVSERESPRLSLPQGVACDALDLALRLPRDEWQAVYATYQLAAKLVDGDAVSVDMLDSLEEAHPRLWHMLENESAQRGAIAGPDAWIEHADEGPVYRAACHAFIEKYKALPVLMVNEAAILDYVRILKDKRLLALMKIPDVQRAHDDLARAFCRALRELRKHQRWLARHALIEVGEDTERGPNA